MRPSGLTSEEVRERKATGKSNDYEDQPSRSYPNIIAKNLLTPFNMLLFILAISLYIVNMEKDPLQGLIDAFSACGIILFNVLISTVQEIRAKRRLDKIALLMRPKVAVIRDGEEREIDRSEIVVDDIVALRSGDQAQVDGEIREAESLEMDESLLTGESDTVRKHVGDSILSGSYCVAGECLFEVTKVGEETFSAKMLSKARRFEKKKTPLQLETNAVTELLMIIAFVYLAILIVKNFLFGETVENALENAVIVLDIVPIALFLLITLTYMIAAVRMAKTGVLLQDSSAVESMSHVDTVCMDKTGTITTNNLVFENIEYLSPDNERTDSLVRRFVGATGSRNRTVVAIENEFGKEECRLDDEVQFSSDRKFSAVRVESPDGCETIVMGAWPFLKERAKNPRGVGERLNALSERGLRSVVFCFAGSAPLHRGDEAILPELEVVAIIAVRDEIRPDCKEILEEFSSNGMDIKVISGDDPQTVDSVFRLAGIPGKRRIASGEELDGMGVEQYEETVLGASIFGRMRPEQKERVIATLRRGGRYVAYVGDGVNDVRSIKKAQVGISVQSGSGAARGVADMVLMNDDFKALPKAIVEGKRTVSGMRDILRLYLTRNFVLSMLVLVLLIVLWKAPMFPIQNTVYALLTVSIAAFFMTFWAKPSDNSELILPKVMRYVLPTTLTITVFALCIYAGVYALTDAGYLDLSPVYDEMKDLMVRMGRWDDGDGGFADKIGTDPAEINARNSMILFLLMSGITQIHLLFPASKRLSADGERTRDFKPIALSLLLFALLLSLYCLREVCVGIAQLVPIPWEYWILFIAATAAWFACTLVLLRWGRLDSITGFVERLIRRSMERAVEEDSRDDRKREE